MSVKNLFSIVVTAFLFASCAQEVKEETSRLVPEPDAGLKKEAASQETSVSKPGSIEKLHFSGDFRAEKMDEKKSPMASNKFSIFLDSVRGETLFGHSVVAGNSRPFSGKLEKKDDHYHAEVSEPGDDKYDGKFSFDVYPDKGHLAGKWTANAIKLAVTERTYDLNKVEFKYNPDQKLEAVHSTVYNSYTENAEEAITEDAGKFNASNTLLKSSDVENMYKRDLEVMRNAIYARHGYSFKNRQMRYYFDGVPWYIPVSTDVTKDLTELEKKNIALIKRYEEHANSYYDEYGR
ncbi:MAG: hypothetical protein K0S12_2157 [Bacteroidetes bacterium]|nr:hypothetical protein [Bacteroidota bacterium]